MTNVVEDIAIAQLAIVDGAWQEAPDVLAQFDEIALFGTRTGRGRMFIVVQVEGEATGRDEVARELIETARREYSVARGSITLALRQAVRAANDALYNINAAQPPEVRRIAGMIAAVLRENEIFVASGGSGLVCVQRGRQFRRYPDTSGWFEPDEDKLHAWLALRDFATPGTAPLGFRRDYSPDTFRVALQPGDGILLSTRALAHLLSNEEVLDTLADHHPDEIVASLEELAGASDLAVFVIRLPGENLNPLPLHPPTDDEPGELELPELEVPALLTPVVAPPVEDQGDLVESSAEPPFEQDREPVPAIEASPNSATRPQESVPSEPGVPGRSARVPVDLTPARNAALRAGATIMAWFALIFSSSQWQRLGAGVDRALSGLLHLLVQFLILLFGRVAPSTPTSSTRGTPAPTRAQAAWQIAAVVVPILAIAFGGWTWASYQATKIRLQNEQIAAWVKDASKALDNGRVLLRTDRNAAREQFVSALQLTERVKALNASHSEARKIANDAQDEIDKLNGVQVLFPVSFATFADPKANPTRVLIRGAEVFILDRGTQRIYRYTFNESGVNLVAFGTEGVIFKPGDKIDNRAIAEIVDMTIIDAGRVVAIERTGGFLQYDPSRAQWSARTATDAAQWRGVTLVGSFSGNLYLADPPRGQIFKYTAASEGVWTAATTYFDPSVRADLTNVVDMTLDENIYLLRGNGEIFRYTSGRPNDLRLRDLEIPFKNPVALVTAPNMNGLYIADAGNQRIVQIDKGNGRFARQFKPSSQVRDTFAALKTFTVDEANRRLIFINGNQAYFATLPQ